MFYMINIQLIPTMQVFKPNSWTQLQTLNHKLDVEYLINAISPQKQTLS
jgi:hypothetical protein